ncbi:MAG: patatin-like phospholipase family protein [Sphaerochaetaceae bacterium]|nr:patatin-like phospholipase family protein [Spirochaetales bacterium]MDY5499777.1 patatin-like phospholipase family protein [Sphaerochaetaceae bacterium]
MGGNALFSRQPKGKRPQERYILCIDGGGMRGVIPCYLLAKLDEMLKALGDQRPLAEHFDLVAGTSTGGLIALALTIPLAKSGFSQDESEQCLVYRPKEQSWMQRLLHKPVIEEAVGAFPRTATIQEISNLYRVNGKRIFPKRQSRLFGSFFTDKYDVGPLEEFLKEKFLDTPLSDAVVPVLATSYNIAESGRPFVFTSRDSHQFLFREAGRATSAAPTYFKPATMTDRVTGEPLMLIDGGLVANNPVLYALQEARKLYPDCVTFHILSLATRQPEIHVEMNGNTGMVAWLDPSQGAPIQRILSTAQEQTSSSIIRSIRGVDYVRVEGQLTTRYKLDETANEALDTLQDDAEAMFKNHKEELERYVRMLSQRTDFDQLKLDPIPPSPTEMTTNALQTTTT